MADYNGSHFGGYHRDFPHVTKRIFDDKRKKRELKISCIRYSGIGIHYYVSGKLETNYWIDEKENILRGFWDDNRYARLDGPTDEHKSDSKVEQFCYGRFNTVAEAQNHIKKIKRKYSKIYKIVDKDAQEELWFYKDGD